MQANSGETHCVQVWFGFSNKNYVNFYDRVTQFEDNKTESLPDIIVFNKKTSGSYWWGGYSSKRDERRKKHDHWVKSARIWSYSGP